MADERGGIRNGTRFNDPAEARLLPSSLMEHGRRSVQHRFVRGGETVHAGSKSTRPCLNVRRIPVERDCVIRSFRSIRRGHRELSRRVLLSVSFFRGFVSFFHHSRHDDKRLLVEPSTTNSFPSNRADSISRKKLSIAFSFFFEVSCLVSSN